MRELDTLRERQLYMLEALKAIDRYCRENDIKYSLAYGSLLGAHRHGGFIPWDDDLDIMMFREEYDKFAIGFGDERYKLISAYNANNYEFAFPRVIDTKTFNDIGKKNILRNKIIKYGISIDIYIIDRTPVKEQDTIVWIRKVNRYVTWRGYATLVRSAFRKLGIIDCQQNFPPLAWLCRRQDKVERKYKNSTSDSVVCFAGGVANNTILNSSLLNEYEDLRFEDTTVMGIKKFDEFLTKRYGDWRTPPKESERIPYHGGKYFTTL